MQGIFPGLLWIAAGSAVGGVARYLVSGLVARTVGETFPWGTMTVNVSGSLAVGLLAATHDAGSLSPLAWQAAEVGFLGSYTTVSSFALNSLTLARDGEWPRAAANAGLSLALCLVAAALGFAAGAALSGPGTP